MKFFLLSNDEDTLVGMRLAGIEGKYVSGKADFLSALEETACRDDIGIIMISSCLAVQAEKELIGYKKNSAKLIVEIPDKNGTAQYDAITGYVHGAIGLG